MKQFNGEVTLVEELFSDEVTFMNGTVQWQNDTGQWNSPAVKIVHVMHFLFYSSVKWLMCCLI